MEWSEGSAVECIAVPSAVWSAVEGVQWRECCGAQQRSVEWSGLEGSGVHCSGVEVTGLDFTGLERCGVDWAGAGFS